MAWGPRACRLAPTYHRILHSLQLSERPDAVEVVEGALSKLLAGKVCDYLGFSSESSLAKGALAMVLLPTSALDA